MKPNAAILWSSVALVSASVNVSAEFQAGAAVVDATPREFPVLVNGGMLSRTADRAITPLSARALVLDDRRERLGIVVVDSCMMPRPLLDEAKRLAARRTRIQPDRILISATHTHSAPAAMGCLGTAPDPDYAPYLRDQLAQALVEAEAHLEPARVGWAVENAAGFTAPRRWILRPDRIGEDPFGNRTVRANMHAGGNWDDVTGESGPEDPDLSLIAFQSRSGRPIAVLANFSMHYFAGQQALSADYFGLFCQGLESEIGRPLPEGEPPFVAMMSHGCSGDIWRRDYTEPEATREPEPTVEQYANGLASIALKAYRSITYANNVDLAMVETRLRLDYRVPDQQRLAWARKIVEELGDRDPRNTAEVYAREQIILHERQSTEVVVQALRMGDIAIATTPCETYALTGLKLKLQSPLRKTMVIELANGGDGYIPPPEQHFLGGYNTWPARSAGLEIQAEPRIAEKALQLLETVAGRSRTHFQPPSNPGVGVLRDAGPVAYWRLEEMSGPRALDASGHDRDGLYEPGVVFFLAGPGTSPSHSPGAGNRAAHFAGGRLRSRITGLHDGYSVSMWFWNGMPNHARSVTGWMFSRDRDHCLSPHGDHLGLAGADSAPGRLIFQHGNDPTRGAPAAGRTRIERWTWNHATLVRNGPTVRAYLNGKLEIETVAPTDFPTPFDQWFFGGRCDNQSNWEGRLDEIAVFDRALSAAEVERLAAGFPTAGHAD